MTTVARQDGVVLPKANACSVGPATKRRAKHKIVIFLTPVKRDTKSRQRLYELLKEIDGDLAGNPYISFPMLSMLHYASFVVLGDGDEDRELIFESNIDGDLDDYFDALRDYAKGLDEIYRCCVGYDETKDAVSYLRDNPRFRVRPRAWHIGNTGRSAEQIEAEAQLRDAIESHVQANAAMLARGSAEGIRQDVVGYVGQRGGEWALAKPPPHQTLADHLWLKGRVVALALAFVAALWWLVRATSLGALLAAVGVWAAMQLVHELLERPAPYRPHDWEEVIEPEDRYPQNHFASVVAIKPSPLRRVGLEIGLWLVNLLNKAVHTKGNLHGIPSIHFAHWSVIPGGRFLFLSNYDGSWGSYLDDFINRAGWIMTAVWSNCVGFPRTWLLVFKGARDAVRLKEWGRSTQVRNQVWYRAYPDLTVAQIDDNSALRAGLTDQLSPDAAQRWARRL